MTTNSTDTAASATVKTEQAKPSAAPVPAQKEVKEVKEVNPYADDARYAQFKVVKLRLLREGTIQYDPQFPELQLTSATEGKMLPLTPFFASRINQTLELVL